MNDGRDHALIARCRQGDRQALEELVECYRKPVYNVAFRMLGDADEAADVTQNAFLKVLDRLDQYRPEFRFFSWIYRIAVNESIDRVERSARQQPLLSDEVSPLPGPDDQADASLLARHVQRCLMTLDAKYRSVLVLKHYSEFSYRQIADTLDLPEKTVKSRLYTARELMRERLQGSSLD